MKKKKYLSKSAFHNNKILSLTLATLLILGIIAYTTALTTQIIKKNNPLKQKVFNLTTNELSKSEYLKIKDDLIQIVQSQDPKAALDHLSEIITQNPEMINSCHALTHEIGRAAYNKYHDFTTALDYQDDLCGSGYLHGIIESYFKNSNDLYSSMATVCSPYHNLSSAGKCYHGVGHGLMYFTDNNLPLSLHLCDRYSALDARIHCSEGIFMENFNSEIAFHPTNYLKPSDPFYPCEDQTSFYKDSCYFYAPDYYLHLHPNDYQGALQWCTTAESGFVLKCLNGVGSRTMKQNLNNPKFVEAICMKTNNLSQTASCLDGMVSYYLVNYFSLNKARALCETLQSENRPTCHQAINKRNSLFIN